MASSKEQSRQAASKDRCAKEVGTLSLLRFASYDQQEIDKTPRVTAPCHFCWGQESQVSYFRFS